MSSRADESVYPLNTTNAGSAGAFVPQIGITLREHFAAMAMQGMLANNDMIGANTDYAADAVRHADELISALAKEKP